MDQAKVGQSEKRKKRGGRVAGVPNKFTKTLKEAILAALEKKGGQKYLERIAEEDPKTFCTLLGRVLPMEVSGANGGPMVVNITRFTED